MADFHIPTLEITAKSARDAFDWARQDMARAYENLVKSEHRRGVSECDIYETYYTMLGVLDFYKPEGARDGHALEAKETDVCERIRKNIVSWAWEENLPTNVKFVLVYIATKAQADWKSFVSVEDISKATGVVIGHTVEAIRFLIKRGLIKHLEELSGGGRTCFDILPPGNERVEIEI
ncbi:helix-turn-helix domain-containing protein [Acetobacter senegalensis]|uniref:helix-turn-helix domain-containing protein n=1 Tax=Acetobacter senegalensis TaxID=446692 RepID=UPI001EDE06F4|nr:helix-turn-helix domain-containing protein [Acetobacter senegalensis]MCG4273916.1 helix-turn-helix domain-containing protein [Acetobacter senegalensis]